MRKAVFLRLFSSVLLQNLITICSTYGFGLFAFSQIASDLDLAPETVDSWIMTQLQSAKIDARIDSQERHIVVNCNPPAVLRLLIFAERGTFKSLFLCAAFDSYQQVIDRTKQLAWRSAQLCALVDRKYVEKRVLGGGD